MKFISPHKYIKNTSANGTILTEHLLNISRRLQTPKRTVKIPTQLGRMTEKKKRKEEMRRDQYPSMELKVIRGSCTQKNPLTVGKSAGAERYLREIRGECSGRPVKGRAK